MATHSWGTDRAVAEELFRAGHRFDFYQAVKLLERLHPGSTPVGEGTEPEKEAVRFKSKISQAFPAADIDAIHAPDRPGTPATMTVNFLGLAGSLSPLPPPYTELILERTWHQDTALRDFLDIFTHRLVSLLYRVRKKHHVGLDFTPPERDAFSSYLLALIGLRTDGLSGRLRVKDRALLFYAGLLAQQPRSMIGLETVLSDYFGIKVKGWQFCGRWYPLEDDQVTRIGVSGQQQWIGRGAVLGTRVWDQQGAVEIRLGPLTLAQFLDFLPPGRGFEPLCELIRFYVGDALDFHLRLLLQAAETPTGQLSYLHGSRLGWTSWLRTSGTRVDNAQVRLRPRS